MKKGYKTEIILFFALLLSITVSSQNIGDLFKMIPLRNYGEISFITKQQKEELIKGAKRTSEEVRSDDALYYLETFDSNNGYLRIQEGINFITMCMWNLDRFRHIKLPAKLIAVSYWMSDGGGNDYLDFFLYQQNTLYYLDDIFDFNAITNAFFEEEVDPTSCGDLYYELPRYGKTIIVHLEISDGGLSHSRWGEIPLSLLKADRAEVSLDQEEFNVVNDYGRFYVNKIYWSEYPGKAIKDLQERKED